MGKKLDATVMNQQLVKLATGTTLAYCSTQPANYAGIAAVTLMAQTGLTCPAPNGGVNGTSGSFTFAAGTNANANGEVGRKATIAAATGIAMGVKSANFGFALLRADRPFLFLIEDVKSGLVLFMGKVEDPNSKE